MTIRAFLVIGTRPEAIKMAPVIQACEQDDRIETIVCLTGQHRELVEHVTNYFNIKPDINLDLMVKDQTLAGLTSRCIAQLDEAMEQSKPDCVVAQGDTTTVMAAALVAFYRGIDFVHVEAGLRSGDLQSPWPEELNRRIATLATSLHCAPTERARDNLLGEHVPEEKIRVTGNTVVDALLLTRDQEKKNSPHWKQKYDWLEDQRMVLVTGHRRENLGEGLKQICAAIRELAEKFESVAFVYPVHLNPRVRNTVFAEIDGLDNVHLIEPVSYPEFVWLMDRSTLIVSDSGGIQEEAPSLGKPVLVTRDNTERPEGVEAGAVELVGTNASNIVARVSALLEDESEYARHQFETNPYGDGKAAQRIVDGIAMMKTL